MKTLTFSIAATVAMTTGAALGDYTVTQTNTSSATYTDHSINFDEAGVPVGVAMDPFDFYQASDGISFSSGSGFLVAEDWDALEGIDGGDGDGNQLNGGFSVRMLFDEAISELSFQGWANGSPSPPFGGINVLLFLDGAQVGGYTGTAAFGGIGDEWFNVVATGGDTFDEVRFFNGAFSSFNSYVDNITFNDVPAPGAVALLGLAGLCGSRRRRG